MRPVHVVFVHGFKSGPATWDPLWKQLSSLESISSGVVLHRYQYATGIVKLKPAAQIPEVPELGEEFATYLQTLPDVAPDDPFVLIGHSQGGLVIQAALAHRLDNREGEQLRCIAHCVFISTPTNGSDFLRAARGFFGRLFPGWTNQEKTLRPLNDFIGELQRQMARDVVYAATATPHSCPIRITAVYGTEDAVVLPQSARWVFRRTEAVPGDHFTVLKPSKPDAPLCTIIERIVCEARYHLPVDGSLVRTEPLFPRDTELLKECLELHHTHFTASQAIRKEDAEHWIGRYEDEFGIRLRMIAALIDDKPRAFLMFHEDAKQDIAVIDYLVARKEDELDHLAVRMLRDRLRSILSQSGIRYIVFEVARPKAGTETSSIDEARIRRFEQLGARVIPQLSYVAPSMDGTFDKDGEEPSLLMVTSIAQLPDSISWSRVRQIVTYLYGTWYRNWFSHRHASELLRMETYLSELAARVLADVPENGTVALPKRFVPPAS